MLNIWQCFLIPTGEPLASFTMIRKEVIRGIIVLVNREESAM